MLIQQKIRQEQTRWEINNGTISSKIRKKSNKIILETCYLRVPSNENKTKNYI